MADENSPDSNTNWPAVIARALAFLCLDKADLRSAKVAEQAEFLECLGLPRRDVAMLLNSSEDSLRKLMPKQKRNGRHERKK
jgi:hypothetical protein